MSSKMTNRLFYLIHEATSETEHEPNMKKNLSIIDRCSKSPFKQKDLAQELKCRLKKKNLTIRFLSIVLLDMCAKNLKGTFVKNLNQKSYMKVLRQVATWKTQTELSERTLALIRYLKNNYSEYKIFSKTFQTLLHKGINFREDPEFGGGLNEKQLSKKVKTNNTQPKRTTNTTNNTFTSTRNNHQNHIIPEELKKVIQDLDVIKETVNLLTQLLLALEPNEKVQSNPLITELVENVKKFRQQLQGLIIEVSDEYVLKLVLETNDQVNNLIRYHTLMLKPNSIEQVQNLMRIEKVKNDFSYISTKEQKIESKSDSDINFDSDSDSNTSTDTEDENEYEKQQPQNNNQQKRQENEDLMFDLGGFSVSNVKNNENQRQRVQTSIVAQNNPKPENSSKPKTEGESLIDLELDFLGPSTTTQTQNKTTSNENTFRSNPNNQQNMNNTRQGINSFYPTNTQFSNQNIYSNQYRGGVKNNNNNMGRRMNNNNMGRGTGTNNTNIMIGNNFNNTTKTQEKSNDFNLDFLMGGQTQNKQQTQTQNQNKQQTQTQNIQNQVKQNTDNEFDIFFSKKSSTQQNQQVGLNKQPQQGQQNKQTNQNNQFQKYQKRQQSLFQTTNQQNTEKPEEEDDFDDFFSSRKSRFLKFKKSQN